MKRPILLVSAALAMIVLAVVAEGQKKPGRLLLLEWSAKAPAETPPLALLIEMGLKDAKPTAWSSRAAVSGARVVHREGYRFRTGDKLVEPNGWEASSHRALRTPPNNPAIAALQGIASIGVVLHLADVQADTKLTIDPRPDGPEKQAVVALSEILSGKSVSLWGGEAAVRRISTATPVVTAKTEDDFPAACYGPDGTLWVAYISYTVKEDSRRIEPPQLKQQPKDFKDYFNAEFGDQLFVKYYKDGKWSEPIAVTGAKEDLMRCAIAAEGNGTVWVVYCANRKSVFDVYARSIARKDEKIVLTEEERLTTGPNLSPTLVTVESGNLALAYLERFSDGANQMHTRGCKDGKWSDIIHLRQREIGKNYYGVRAWHPALCSGPGQNFAVLYEDYLADYDINYAVLSSSSGGVSHGGRLCATSRFEARPSICYDPAGRLWIAYEEGPVKWGKDYGAQDDKDGSPLYNERSVRVVCFHEGKLYKPAAELPTASFKPPTLPFDPGVSQRYEKAARYAQPQIGIDGKGRVWLTYRQKFGTRYSTHPGSYWLTFARRLDGDRWSEPIEIHHSDGMLDHRPVLLPHPAGGLRVIHNTDGRFTTPEHVDNQIYMSYVDLPGETMIHVLAAHEPEKKDEKLVQEAAAERETINRIRKYRVEAGDKKYQLLRGEFHRHTEISSDGGSDGSLEDMFRYAIDAAAMDWIGNGDHDSGNGREYSWWLIQKYTDAYTVKDRFTGMFTYERSVPYPHGHRNCMFVQRGVRTLPRLAEEDPDKRVGGIHADDTKMLYRYLREHQGICAVHTSATSMGTDWRDNDPLVEPIVEIYQGDRMSYEIEGAPRAGFDPASGKLPANVAGWFPAGYINNAFKKDYRLGFQASSDHWSTHISYCIVLAERNDRAAILDAIKKRHCYGATDDIIADVRSGKQVMGDAFKTSAAPTLQIKVIGTRPLARIDILKDSAVVETLKPGQQEYTGSWTDPKPTAGVHYYYIRALQTDGEIAWTSPMWIDYAR